MKPDQVDVVAATVFGDSQQILHALESRLTGEIIGDVADRHRRDRIDDDVAVVHRVAATHLDVRAHPDANAASDAPAADALAKLFGEDHCLSESAA